MKKDWDLGIEPTREEREAQRQRNKRNREAWDLIRDLFGGFDVQHDPNELKRGDDGEDR